MNFKWAESNNVLYLWLDKIYQVRCYGVIRRNELSGFYRYSCLTTLDQSKACIIETDDIYRPYKDFDVDLPLLECKDLLLKRAAMLYESDIIDIFSRLRSGDYYWETVDFYSILYVGSREMGFVISGDMSCNYQSIYLEECLISENFLSLSKCKDALIMSLCSLNHCNMEGLIMREF